MVVRLCRLAEDGLYAAQRRGRDRGIIIERYPGIVAYGIHGTRLRGRAPRPTTVSRLGTVHQRATRARSGRFPRYFQDKAIGVVIVKGRRHRNRVIPARGGYRVGGETAHEHRRVTGVVVLEVRG